MIWNFVGIAAGTIMVSSQIPQIIKGLKTKSLEDLSMGMLACIITGLYFWFLYGYHLQDWIMILSNLAGIFLTYMLILMKKHYHG